MQLTEHFTLAELTESETAVRLGIDNTPPDDVIENLKRTAELGESIRAILSEHAKRDVYIKVLYGYRCEALERVLCDKDYRSWCSRHILGDDDGLCWKQYFSKKGHPQGRCMDFHAPLAGNPYHIVHLLCGKPEIMAQVDQIILEGVTVRNEGWIHVGWREIPRHQIMTAIFDKDGVPHYVNKLT